MKRAELSCQQSCRAQRRADTYFPAARPKMHSSWSGRTNQSQDEYLSGVNHAHVRAASNPPPHSAYRCSSSRLLVCCSCANGGEIT
ncbi:hypothetical protein CRENBAI_012560 [Crenichthys baileyi]|uniref:Uncharacterized protein n=1 Tax=Crenichthys baileyi TaxID=28760 RepID=A0AAV9RFJ2_9TELE